MPPVPNESLLEESQDTGCAKKRSLPCILLFVLIILIILAVVVGLVILMLEKAVKPPSVELECGTVTGVYDFDHDVLIFKGIPYAAPPVGELRWRRPVPPHRDQTQDTCWSGTLDATTTNECPKFNSDTGEVIGEEDCLKLNVWAPGHQLRESLLPVVVYVHGGGLVNLNSTVPGYSPDANLTREMHAVFVSLNYRLGPLGFLVAKELGENQTGNYGLWDQIEALKWVNKNIHLFGGDPEQVLLMGHSAGGASLKALLVSPHAKGLFHRAWSVSGAPRLEYTFQDALDSELNKKIVAGTGCKDAACLRNVSLSEIFKKKTGLYKETILPRKGHYEYPYIVIEGDLIHDTVEEIWGKNKTGFSDVPLLIGTAAHEMEDMWPSHTPNSRKSALLNKTWGYLNTFGDNVLDEALEVYNYTRQSIQDSVYQLITSSSDIYVNCGNNRVATFASAAFSNPVYRYVVTSFPSSPVSPYNHDVLVRYAFHSLDPFAFFNGQEIYMHGPLQKQDLDFKKAIHKMAKEFIHDGQLTGWKEFPASTAMIGDHVTFAKGAYHKKQCDFWESHGILKHAWC